MIQFNSDIVFFVIRHNLQRGQEERNFQSNMQLAIDSYRGNRQFFFSFDKQREICSSWNLKKILKLQWKCHLWSFHSVFPVLHDYYSSLLVLEVVKLLIGFGYNWLSKTNSCKYTDLKILTIAWHFSSKELVGDA